MIDRDKIMEQAKRVFATAWHDEDDRTDGDTYVIGSRRQAGLHAVFDLLEREYTIMKKKKDTVNERRRNFKRHPADSE